LALRIKQEPATFSIDSYLADCRKLALSEIERQVPSDARHTAGLYELMLDIRCAPRRR
jgi:hypothetical protein